MIQKVVMYSICGDVWRRWRDHANRVVVATPLLSDGLKRFQKVTSKRKHSIVHDESSCRVSRYNQPKLLTVVLSGQDSDDVSFHFIDCNCGSFGVSKPPSDIFGRRHPFISLGAFFPRLHIALR